MLAEFPVLVRMVYRAHPATCPRFSTDGGSPWHPSPSKYGRGPRTLWCGSNRNRGVLSTMSRWYRPEWSVAPHLIFALGKGWRWHLAPGPVSHTIPGHMSGLITPEGANSCQSPPAVPRNVALAITPITHDPTMRARPPETVCHHSV